MDHPAFQCLKCGKCCNPGQVDPETSHFIPIYLNEVDEILRLAEERNLAILLEPDLMYFDELNNRLIIVTYALNLENGGCPFYSSESDCTIYDQRPITCKAYPFAIFQQGETTGVILKPECSFVQEHHQKLKELDYYELGEVFGDEFPFSREIQITGNAITTKILQLEGEGKIRIPIKAPVEITEETKNMEKVRLDNLSE
jgi:Fe-S-cluster containining protein